jgi:DNA-binding NarL/FixJ family response regulator
MIRLLLVDDQILIRQGLISLLESQSDFQIVGNAENGQKALELLTSLQETPSQPDVVLLDIRMPVMDGVATTKEICHRFSGTGVLILSTFDDQEYVAQSLRLGARGYLLKDTPLEELAVAIRSIHKGYTHLAAGLFEKAVKSYEKTSLSTPSLPPQLAKLSTREKEVLSLIASGASNREIAQVLYLSERTVKNHITSILSRLELRDRTQAALLAISFGYGSFEVKRLNG